MGLTLAQKIIRDHLVTGTMTAGSEIGLRIDQTLTQDATGTMAYLEFEAMGKERVSTERSVAYIDHNTLQCGFENADDHLFIQSAAEKYGIVFSRPGNGICHQLHLELFGKPCKTLIGSDSHTPTGGGIGMLAFGAGGMDVAVAMGGGEYFITMPKMMKINLTGKLRPFVSAKDIALEALRLLSVKGGVGYIIEWGGDGIATLSAPERATITNMGAELGASTSIFPSDDVTRAFLAQMGREADFVPLASDPDAVYDKELTIDLDTLVPLAACPHSPDNVVPVASLGDIAVNQVCIGSCTNSSLDDLMKVASILRGRRIADSVSLSLSPGSRSVLSALADSGALNDILLAGARLLECACGPCIGMGFSPNSAGVSLRTFNRNFEGRSGTKDGRVYLVSPETAAASALFGKITDPRTLGDLAFLPVPARKTKSDGLIFPADAETAKTLTLKKGPNIKSYPTTSPLADSFTARVSLKVGDNITTDHIMPAGAKILPFRSNIPYMSQFCFGVCDGDFPARAKEYGQSFVIGGENYGQGSSREHAALVPLYLGVRFVIAKSFARIHAANLINAGIVPLTFADPADYDKIELSDTLSLEGLPAMLATGVFTLKNGRTGELIPLSGVFSDRQKAILQKGGLLAYTAGAAEAGTN